jgi:4-hydroxy-tetrahydrodipicolinate synthase
MWPAIVLALLDPGNRRHPMTPFPRTNLISAVTTLFDRHGAVDLGATRAAYQMLAASSVDAVFVAGTTGEFVTLTDEERLDVCSVANDAFGADRTYWHVGSASTHQAVRLTKAAVGRGARHLAALTPHYFAATESAVLSYYETVVKQADGVPVFGYLFPERSTTSVAPAQLPRIAETGTAGLKISGLSYFMLREYREALGGRKLPIYSGADSEFVEVVEVGGAGVVSGVSSALPKPFVEVRDALRIGDATALSTARQRAHRAVAATRQGHLAFLKAILELRGLPARHLRAPLDPISPGDRRQLASEVSDLL